MTARNLFIVALVLILLAFTFSLVTNITYNRLTHACVVNKDFSNLTPSQVRFLESQGFLTKEEYEQKRYFCSSGMHPELTRRAKDVSRHVWYGALAFSVPVGLCTGALLLKRYIHTQFRR